MDNESKQLLKDINKSLNVITEKVEEIEGWNDIIANTQFPDKNPSNYDISNSDINIQILSLIFGFIVGFCLIKSFFDGLKV